MAKQSFLIPLGIFVGLIVILGVGFTLNDPKLLPSAKIGQPFPEFSLPDLKNPEQQRSQDEIKGPALVNVWATWCFACRIEHPMLNDLAKQGIKIVGLNYKDQRSEAIKWLDERGNPYLFNIFDAEGNLGFDLGVYGAPETYLVDVEGTIRHRRVGVVDQRIWDKEFRDLYQQLLKEAL